MDFEELRAFLAIAREGSLLGAAVSLGVPRTTVRRRVEALEARLGASLLARERSGAQLTEAGRALFEEGPQLMEQTQAVLSVVRQAGKKPQGRLRVALPIGLPPQALVPAFVLVRARYPSLSFRVLIDPDPTSRLLDDADLALDLGFADPPGALSSRLIATLDERLVASPAYLARAGTPTRVEDLRQHTLFVWEGPGTHPHELPLAGGGWLRVEPAIVAPDIHLLRSLARAGQGIAFVPDALLPEDAATPGGDLVGVLEPLVLRRRQLRLVAPEVLSRTPNLRVVLALGDQLAALVARMRRCTAGRALGPTSDP